MYEVRAAPGKGKGLFATRDIPALACIGLFSTEGGDCWCMMVGDFRYANHSDKNPNIDWAFDDGPMTITFTALQDIKAGEELVYNYGCELWFTPLNEEV
jgi:hypothetical protein